MFIPRSEITALRRRLVEELDKANLTTYRFDMRRSENLEAIYPSERLDFRDNVANSLAREFYRSHGVKEMEDAMEVTHGKVERGTQVMTTRHCILRELGMCRKDKGAHPEEPLVIDNGQLRYRLRFDCSRCEMHLLTD